MKPDLLPGEGLIYLLLDEVEVGDRVREDMKDLDALVRSVGSVGLLHPIVITPRRRLVAGGRRLAAVRQLGWTEIPVRVVDAATAEAALRAEADENTCRAPLTPYEASEMRRRIATVLAPVAKERQGDAIKERDGKGRALPTSPKLGEVGNAPADRRVAKTAAIGTGYSGSSLDKVERIRDAAERGVIRKGKTEVPAPAPVVAAAKKALTEVKKTGAAIDRSHREVAKAIEDYAGSAADTAITELINGSQSVQDARYLHKFASSIAKADDFLRFDAERLAQIGGDDELTSVRHLLESTKTFLDRMTRARSGLRLVNGGKA